jgi:hypothetical protein
MREQGQRGDGRRGRRRDRRRGEGMEERESTWEWEMRK